MKKLSVLFALLAVAMMAKAEGEDLVISAQDFQITPGSTATLTIEKSGTQQLSDYFNFQFDLYLPEGIYVPAGDNGDYTVDVWNEDDEEYIKKFMYQVPINKSQHETKAAIQDDGALRFVTTGGISEARFRNTTNNVMVLTVAADESVAPGTYEAKIANVVFSGKQSGGTEIDTKPADFTFDITVAGASETEVSFTMTAAGYGTLILPFEAEVPEGLKAYTCAEAEGNVLTLVEATTLAANAPYIMEGAEGTYEFTGTPKNDAVSYTVGLLTGLLEAGKAPVGSYVLQNQAKGVGFYIVTSEAKDVKANRCYLTMPAGNALMYRIGGTTNIEEITVDDNAEVYDVLGRKVLGPLQKGVYIKDGHKIYVK